MNDTSNTKPYLIAVIALSVVTVAALIAAGWLAIRFQQREVAQMDQVRDLERQIEDGQAGNEEEAADAPTEEKPAETSEKRVVSGEEEPLYQTTYLQKQFLAMANAGEVDSDCRSFAEIASDGSFAPSDINIMENASVRTEIRNRVGAGEAEAFIDDLGFVVQEGEKLDRLCASWDGRTLVSVAQNLGQVRFFEWITDDPETPESYFLSFSPIARVFDLSYTYLTGINGQDYVYTSFGDAGHVWWSYYHLDPVTRHSDLVEDCNGNFVYNEDTGEFEDAFEFSCLREYTP
jgi:hypothetical protein